ncbi:hypothetical protein [Shewanella sp.]|uniref:hypothetical protein n=1 Tax=Shewanella sp. TaxID=50422 RepID=UPI00405381E3
MKKLLLIIAITSFLSFPLLATEDTPKDTGSEAGNEPMGSSLCVRQPRLCFEEMQ